MSNQEGTTDDFYDYEPYVPYDEYDDEDPAYLSARYADEADNPL